MEQTIEQPRPAREPELKMLNGVDLERLGATMDAVKGDPGVADFRFRAHNKWIDGGHNRTTIQSFSAGGVEDTSREEAFVVHSDSPHVLLGTDRAPDAVEHLLSALAACMTTSLVYHAAARGIRLQEVESTLEGDLDLRGFLGLEGAARNGYRQIRVAFRIRADVPDEQLEELVQLAQDRSPVFDIVTHPVPVEVSVARIA